MSWGKILLVGAIVVIASALVLSEFRRHENERALDAIEVEVAETRETAEAALRALIPPATLETIDRSIYEVLSYKNNRYSSVGTAFLIDRENGILGTNAHVADYAKELGGQIFVSPAGSGEKIPVVASRVHAGYGAFRKLVEPYGPMKPSSLISAPTGLVAHDSSFDAALLIVDPIDAETGENRLGPEISLAPEADLLALKKGDPIAIVGFPGDRIDRPNDDAAPTSRVVRGVISTVHGPLPGMENAPAHLRNFIAHRLDTRPGNSGSPVVNTAGKVIGVETFGNDRDNVAVRADTFYDLLQPLGEERTMNGLFVPAWQAFLETMAPAQSVIPIYVYKDWNTEFFGEENVTIDEAIMADHPFDAKIETKSFGGRHNENRPFILPADDLIEDADPKKDGFQMPETVGSVQVPIFRFEEDGEYVATTIKVDPDVETIIFAYDYAVTGNVAFCGLNLIARFHGSEDYTNAGQSGVPSIYYTAAAENTPSSDWPNLDVIVIRKPFDNGEVCDESSKDFSLGVIRFDPEDDAGKAMTASLLRSLAHNSQEVLPPIMANALSRGAASAKCALASAKDSHSSCAALHTVKWTGETMTLDELAAHHAKTGLGVQATTKD